MTLPGQHLLPVGPTHESTYITLMTGFQLAVSAATNFAFVILQLLGPRSQHSAQGGIPVVRAWVHPDAEVRNVGCPTFFQLA